MDPEATAIVTTENQQAEVNMFSASFADKWSQPLVKKNETLVIEGRDINARARFLEQFGLSP